VTRLWLLTAALLALALAGCGPDCEQYCTKLEACAARASIALTRSHADCLSDCNAVGDEKTATVQCVIDHDCADLGKRCTPTGGQYPP
jgi:hypothetical protein